MVTMALTVRKRWLLEVPLVVIAACLIRPTNAGIFREFCQKIHGERKSTQLELQGFTLSLEQSARSSALFQQTANDDTHPVLCKASSTPQHAASNIIWLALLYVTSLDPKLCHFLSASELTLRLSRLRGLSPTTVLILVNSVVHIVWRLVIASGSRKKFEFMAKHFILSGRHSIEQKRPHTHLTAAFSHISTKHFVNNMSDLLMVGPSLEKALTPRQYAYFYVGAIYASDFLDAYVFQGETIFLSFLKVSYKSTYQIT